MSGDSIDSGERRSCTVDPHRMDVFIEAMTPPGPAHLRSLEKQALDEGVPVIRPQTQNLIRFFLTLNRPRRILEIGTGVGFSALFMQYYAPPDCRITTIEIDPVRAEKARENFTGNIPENCSSRREDRRLPEPGLSELFSKGTGSYSSVVFDTAGGSVELLEGDAADILPRIRKDAFFDLVFMDAAKGQYIRFLPEVLRLLGEGGILITDNILQEGDVLSSRFAVTRRNRTIHSRMRAYVRALMEAPELETLLVPSGDGAAVCVKRRRSGGGC